MNKSNQSLISISRIENAILMIRDEKVMLDENLAAMYGVTTKVLVQAVKRNIDRFPEDFKLGRTQNASICVYRTGRGNAFQRFKKQKSCFGKC